MMLVLGMEVLFSIYNILIVRKLNKYVIDTVGLTKIVITTFVYLKCVGLSTATTIIIARLVGKRKPEKAGLVAVQAI